MVAAAANSRPATIAQARTAIGQRLASSPPTVRSSASTGPIRLTVVSSPKRPQPKSVKLPRRGGWRHPLALALLISAMAWAVGTFFATSTKDFPKVGTVPLLSGIGGWNWAIAIVLALVATSIADRTRPPVAPGSRGWRYAGVAMSVSALLGLLWVVVFYVISNTAVHIPFYSDLGQWNILIGMGFIIAAFAFATKWE